MPPFSRAFMEPVMPRTSANPAGRRLTARGAAAFLEALAETGMVGEAAARAGVPRASLYRRKAADPDFAAAWASALEAGLDGLRDEAVRRARDGVEQTVWYRGEPVGTVRRYSDQLLMFLLRAHQPAVYREPRGNARAEEEEEEVDEISAMLARIDGKTRSIHAEGDEPDGVSPQEWRALQAQLRADVEARVRAEAEAADAAADATGPDGADDGPEAAGDDAARDIGYDREAAEPVYRPPPRPRPYIPVEEPAAFVRPGSTVGLDYDPLDPYPRDPP
jgi:hypothetical protein